MTIEKGESWGEPVGVATGFPVVSSDHELARLAAESVAAGEQLTARLNSGDLAATLGFADSTITDSTVGDSTVGEGPTGEGERLAFPIDLGMATLDGAPAVPFVAHLTVRRLPALAAALGHGPGIEVSVMNAALLGPFRLGPRAHPNDGLIDVTEGAVPFRHRWEAAKRARSGSHLPHPDLRHRRLKTWQGDFPRPVSVWLDGVAHGRARTIHVDLIEDALRVLG